ncbi:MAG: hypothetical protein ACSW8H_01855 [bacterium]
MMKTDSRRIALRALAVAVILFGATVQSDKADAECYIKGGDTMYKCVGPSGMCRVMVLGVGRVTCDGGTIAQEVGNDDPSNPSTGTGGGKTYPEEPRLP